MPEANVFQTISEVGGYLGTGAALILFWMYNKIKELSARVKRIEHENETFKQTLADIRSDVSYIRGKLEDK